jgi:tetratricopeptide (TPR) repeat protein
MRLNPAKLVAPCLAALLAFLSGSPVAAADANSEVRWLVNLIAVNNGRVFCAPAQTRFADMWRSVQKYAQAHPELNGRINDQQTLQALADAYPCSAEATAELSNSPISSNIGKTVEVTPTGEFASIDTKPALALMQKLMGTKAHENDELVAKITGDSGSYPPPVLFALADLYYRQGDFYTALFWFNAARLRGNLDATLCTDVSARSAVPTIVQQMPADLRQKQFDNLPKLKEIVEQVFTWDQATPYNYDRRWISLHGMRAINSGLGAADSGAPLTVPREMWGELARKNRENYRRSLDSAIDMALKQKPST